VQGISGEYKIREKTLKKKKKIILFLTPEVVRFL
jgi:hypothetical protein